MTPMDEQNAIVAAIVISIVSTLLNWLIIDRRTGDNISAP